MSCRAAAVGIQPTEPKVEPKAETATVAPAPRAPVIKTVIPKMVVQPLSKAQCDLMTEMVWNVIIN